MDFLKALFESGALTWEEFSQAVTEKGFKLADLATGKYVSKSKYDDDLAAKDTAITDLKGQIATRDTDLADLKTQLETAGTDNRTKVAELTNQITKLQSDYNTVKSDYEGRLSKQSYEFAVKEYANEKKFTSNAAKRDFINEMIKANLEVKDNQLQNVDEFVAKYVEANADALVVETPAEPEPPKFVNPTNPTPAPEENAFINAFQFAGVRPKTN